MPWSFSASRSAAPRRWPALLRTVVISAALAGSLSACVPLVVTGMVGGLLLATDRRSAGAQIDDEAIEMRGSSRISAVLQNRGSVSITSYNRVVLLTGQVYSQADRDLVENTAKTLPNVRYIVNEIDVGYPSSSTASDALTSTRVKTALVGSRNVRSNAVKVTTENGVVYLMGTVTQQESDQAALVASARVDQLGLPAARFGPAQVHSFKHGRPILRVRSTCSSMDGQQGVAPVVRAREHRVKFALADFLFNYGNFGLQFIPQPFIAKLGQLDGILDSLVQAGPILDLFAQAGHFFHQPLGAIRFIPQARIFSLLLVFS